MASPHALEIYLRFFFFINPLCSAYSTLQFIGISFSSFSLRRQYSLVQNDWCYSYFLFELGFSFAPAAQIKSVYTRTVYLAFKRITFIFIEPVMFIRVCVRARLPLPGYGLPCVELARACLHVSGEQTVRLPVMSCAATLHTQHKKYTNTRTHLRHAPFRSATTYIMAMTRVSVYTIHTHIWWYKMYIKVMVSVYCVSCAMCAPYLFRSFATVGWYLTVYRHCSGRHRVATT